MVSHHYAKEMTQRPRLPLLIDSGGFAALFEGSRILERSGLGILETNLTELPEVLTPMEVLDFQEEKADVAFTLDFPIPVGTDQVEAERRQRLSISNAIWAIRNRRRKEMCLYGCIQAWDEKSAADCVRQLTDHPFDGFAIGGLVPRAKNWDLIEGIVSKVLAELDGRPLHVFGLGKPEISHKLFEMGVDSVDSSSYVKMAADGRKWSDPNFRLEDLSTPELLKLAIENLATATSTPLPLAVQSRNLTQQNLF